MGDGHYFTSGGEKACKLGCWFLEPAASPCMRRGNGGFLWLGKRRCVVTLSCLGANLHAMQNANCYTHANAYHYTDGAAGVQPLSVTRFGIA